MPAEFENMYPGFWWKLPEAAFQKLKILGVFRLGLSRSPRRTPADSLKMTIDKRVGTARLKPCPDTCLDNGNSEDWPRDIQERSAGIS
jgi:hypothetical protein